MSGPVVTADERLAQRRAAILRAVQAWRPRAAASVVVSGDGTCVAIDSLRWQVEAVRAYDVILRPVDPEQPEAALGMSFALGIPEAPPSPAPPTPLTTALALGARCTEVLNASRRSFSTWQRLTAPVRADGTVSSLRGDNLPHHISQIIQAQQESTAAVETGPALVAETRHAVAAARTWFQAAERVNYRLAGERRAPSNDDVRLDEVERTAETLEKALDVFRPAAADLAVKTPPLLVAALRELRAQAVARYGAESAAARQRLVALQEALGAEERQVTAVIERFDVALAGSVPNMEWSDNPFDPPRREA